MTVYVLETGDTVESNSCVEAVSLSLDVLKRIGAELAKDHGVQSFPEDSEWVYVDSSESWSYESKAKPFLGYMWMTIEAYEAAE